MLSQPFQTLCRVGPCIQPMPGGVQLAAILLAQFLQAETRTNAVEVAPVQIVELAERNAAGPNLLHRRLIFRAPGFRERDPVELVPKWLKELFGLTSDAAPPIHYRPEYI